LDTNGIEALKLFQRPQRPVRLVMYSHDTMGLGHMRRNLLLAQALGDLPHGATILLIAGACEIGGFRLPPGVDFLCLPALRKCEGIYRPRRLDVSLAELTALRQRTIQAAVEAFQPDVLLVDNVPWGAAGELAPTLSMMANEPTARCVLGLRDILDDAQTIRREWCASGTEEAVSQFYDAVWIYGEQKFFDQAAEYGWSSEIAGRVTYVGFLNQSRRLEATRCEPHLESVRTPYAACVVGGGQDGFKLAETFLRASIPDDLTGVVVTGPCMEQHDVRRLRELAQELGRRCVVEFPAEADAIICGAQRVVGMGGYNTLCAILSHEKPALIVPRVQPRCEQWMRAHRLSVRGLIETLHPDDLSPEALTRWLQKDILPPRVRGNLDFDGLERVPGLLAGVIEKPRLVQRQPLLKAFEHAGI
jgi:predicted glycosyltransferase